MTEKSLLRFRVLIVVAALLFSTGGAAIKACHFSGWQVAGFRSGIAAAALFALIPGARRCRSWRIALTACAYAATLVLFVLANKETTSANAIFLQSTAPLYLLLLSPLVLKERVGREDLVVFIAILFGMALLLGGGWSGHARGNAFGLLSGVAWAFTLTGLRWIARHEPASSPEAPVALGNLFAFAACLSFSLPVANAGLADIALLLWLGVFQIALAYICLTRSIRFIPAVEAATLLLVEPVFNPLWAWLLQHENPGVNALAGGAVISAAACCGSWWKSRLRI